ncbi:hypothetical protein E4K72_08720 [Oxalobacteraceae bacterium OM1]|nr:hypothetical protein E4K72_08720 [Oxalobacteraceae bacterium OM1]
MQADSALSHLRDGELCIVRTREGEREAVWRRAAWRFYPEEGRNAGPYKFDDIEEWRPASIRFTP